MRQLQIPHSFSCRELQHLSISVTPMSLKYYTLVYMQISLILQRKGYFQSPHGVRLVIGSVPGLDYNEVGETQGDGFTHIFMGANPLHAQFVTFSSKVVQSSMFVTIRNRSHIMSATKGIRGEALWEEGGGGKC